MADTGDADVEDWVAAALADDALPAFALLGLSAARPAALKWGVTQPRSRPRDDDAPPETKRPAEDAGRGSPTTPLSWSDGAGTGAEEACSSRSAKRKAKASEMLLFRFLSALLKYYYYYLVLNFRCFFFPNRIFFLLLLSL